jgi:hypothetical protein
MNGIGQFYKIEALALLIGAFLFLFGFKNKKIKTLIFFWILLSVFPASLTRDGGNHATRLILMLPPLVFLISYGIAEGVNLLKGNKKVLAAMGYVAIWAISFFFYQHNMRFHYPWNSERWWHAGWKEAVNFVKDEQSHYDRVFISMADEPAWIFFAAWYEYPPDLWQKNFPVENKTFVEGFGKVSYTDKFYFGSTNADGGIYALPNYITEKDLYLASAKEVPGNLIMNPTTEVPIGLKLLKAVAFPSGEPAFYLFTKSE